MDKYQLDMGYGDNGDELFLANAATRHVLSQIPGVEFVQQFWQQR